jgi:hypothetical protein
MMNAMGGPRNTLVGRMQQPMRTPEMPGAPGPGGMPSNTLAPRTLQPQQSWDPMQTPFRNLLQDGSGSPMMRRFADIGNPGLRSLTAIPQGI